jgi:type IV pilus assembly protein PilQ
VLIAQVPTGGRPILTVAQDPAPAAAAAAAEEPPPTPQSLAEGITLQGPVGDEQGAPRFGVTTVGGEKQYYGAPISMSLKDADITEVLRSLARISGLNIVIQPGVAGPVTVELESVPWDQALDQILKINQLGMELEGNILRIAPVSRLAQEAEEQQRLQSAKSLSLPLTTVMRRISYASADEIAGILQRGRGGTGLMSQRASVIVDGRTNTLIIQELPAYMDQVISIIENLDIPEDQVMIEARIVETTKNWSRSLGFDWTMEGVADAAHGNTTGVVFPNNISGADDAPTATGGANLLTGGANGFLNIGLGNILNTFELDVVLQAAENEGLVNVISAPKVATLNNERASIQSGLQIPVQTVANNTVTVQFVNATLRLDVTPHITAEGTVLLEIQIQKREPQQGLAIVGAPSAPIATRDARTRVLVRDGGTAVIGGIYEVSTDESQDRVPGLANIPILGHLFKNRNRSNTNEELLIFITPRVVKL